MARCITVIRGKRPRSVASKTREPGHDEHYRMDCFCDINWFAVHAKRYREKVAAASVGALGLEVFLPMVKVECSERAVIKVGCKALFSGYFFARFSPAIFLDVIEFARGVLYVIKSGSLPVAVDARVIREIQDRVEGDGLIRLQRGEFRAGDRVCIQEGPFAGMVGRVEAELDDHERVAILLEAMWNARLLVEKRWVEAETV
jgi:transcription antitermination factor NusG